MIGFGSNISGSLVADYGPYTTLVIALTLIPIRLRKQGKTVGITFFTGTTVDIHGVETDHFTTVEYWWKDGIADADLVLKNPIPTPFDPSITDLDSFLNESGNPYVRADVKIGKIKLSDPNKSHFYDLTTANTYVKGFTSATITDESFDSVRGIYSFTVPAGSPFNNATGFCDDNQMNFQDPKELVISFGNGCFFANATDNIFGNITAEPNFLASSSGNNTMGDVTGVYSFLASSSGNNTMGDVTAGTKFLAESTGNNTMGDVTAGDISLEYSSGNNTMGDVTAGGSFLASSSGNNTMGDVTAETKFLVYSTGNNTMGDVTAGDSFLVSSSGNNTMGDVTVSNGFLGSSSGNNTMKTIIVGGGGFLNASPSIKNTIYKIQSCQNVFANGYTGRMDVGLFGNDGTQNLPENIFTTGNLAWINTPYSNKFINGGSEDADITQARDNMTNYNKEIFFN